MDPVSICNVALGHLGEKRITQLDENAPKSRAEELLVSNYALAVALVLEARQWSFATEWQKLAKAAAAGAHPVLGASRFLIPSTVLRVVGVDDGSGACVLPWQKEGRYIYAEGSELYIRAISLVEDPDEWSPSFAYAVAFKLAAVLAIPLTENKSLRDEMEAQYLRTLREAAALDGTQGTAEQRKNVGPRPSDMRR